MYELSIIIARYVNPVSEVTVHSRVRDDEMPEPERDDERAEGYEENGHEENGHEENDRERDL